MPTSSTVIVVDSGIGLYAVTNAPLHQQTLEVWTAWQADDAEIFAPELWRYEITSILHKLKHLGEVTDDEAKRALDAALSLDVQFVETDNALCKRAFEWATLLKVKAAYDTFYVALAEQLNATLWTGDKRLANNLRQHGVKWVQWIGGVSE